MLHNPNETIKEDIYECCYKLKLPKEQISRGLLCSQLSTEVLTQNTAENSQSLHIGIIGSMECTIGVARKCLGDSRVHL